LEKAISKIEKEIQDTKVMIDIYGKATYWQPYLDGLNFALDAMKSTCKKTGNK
jgi:hypothetical protein